ncbi:MAG TPA: C4-dicarboxylate ABC transporter [Thermotogota bacterium]|nr:C4-dicarboxylate ABC transporter [Thermotogota bacterium]MDD8052504.1 C4-dicarboxylate ABC transporter [Thermotogota bacterium]HNR63755.1 C4-dicarboxylate ABC transporter [Thermotogota bacterium]HNT95614.1 C4-dicarboxylate ABC transporter [Thermotogota bacterium]HOZ11884.1 C4-dicarboxylate ABC transporter [Thermotogota bacterium]
MFNDPQFFQTIGYALAMAGGYVVGKIFKLSTEICLFLAALVGALVAGAGFDVFRHFAEGSVTYFDIGLIFIFATLFMNILKESGAMDLIVRWIIRVFGGKKILFLILLMVVMLIPGALTGAGSISVLVVGGTVSAALGAMGLKKERVAAIIFIVAGLSAAAPPVNVWAMMTCAGTAVPYVGFTWPLLVPVLILGLFTVLFLGWKGKIPNIQEALKAIPEPVGLSVWSVAIPFIALIALLALPRIIPFDFPMLGLPLSFAISALVAWLMNYKRIKIFRVFSDTVAQLTPLLATTVVVGMFVQVMSFNGTKGLFSLWIVTAPMALLYIILPFVIPISEGLLTYGGVAVLGIPLIWMFNARGINTVIALAGLTLLWPLGDGLPPTKLIGRLTVDTVGYKGSYGKFLKECIVPWIAITVVGILMVAFSNQLSFLMG